MVRCLSYHEKIVSLQTAVTAGLTFSTCLLNRIIFTTMLDRFIMGTLNSQKCLFQVNHGELSVVCINGPMLRCSYYNRSISVSGSYPTLRCVTYHSNTPVPQVTILATVSTICPIERLVSVFNVTFSSVPSIFSLICECSLITAVRHHHSHFYYRFFVSRIHIREYSHHSAFIEDLKISSVNTLS